MVTETLKVTLAKSQVKMRLAVEEGDTIGAQTEALVGVFHVLIELLDQLDELDRRITTMQAKAIHDRRTP